MNKILKPGVSLLLVLWIFGGSYWIADHFSTVNPVPDVGFHFKHQDFKVKSDDNFYFAKDAAHLSIPEQCQHVLEQSSIYFMTQPDHEITLTGMFSSAETYSGSYPDLGIARAESLKKKYVDLGIPPKQIKTESKPNADVILHNDRVYNAVSIKFEKVLDRSVLIKKEKPIFVKQKKLSQKKLVQGQTDKLNPPYKVRKLNLYFPQSTYKLKIVPELKEYFEEVLVYLAKNPKAKVWVIGHTDDKGDRKVNIRLSKYRARAVRDFMFEHGFKKNQIQIDYKGPDEPIATNDTEEGRTKNRRVEVRVVD